jgi:hypothetical protein
MEGREGGTMLHRGTVGPALVGIVLLLVVTLVTPVAGKSKSKKKSQPNTIEVQHCLIGFGKSTGKKLDRTKKEAEALAAEILERAQAGEDFDAMVKEYTNDQYPGIYKMTNRGAPIRSGYVSREDMVTGFGDVAFQLEVGEVGMCKYSAVSSPYGWHIIKRLE